MWGTPTISLPNRGLVKRQTCRQRKPPFCGPEAGLFAAFRLRRAHLFCQRSSPFIDIERGQHGKSPVSVLDGAAITRRGQLSGALVKKGCSIVGSTHDTGRPFASGGLWCDGVVGQLCGAEAAWMAVSAMVNTMSSTSAPRDRSLTGLRRPCSIGPTESTLALRCTAL